MAGFPETGPWPHGSFLAGLDPASADRLLALGKDRTYAPGTRLLSEGDRTTYLLVLLSGCVKVIGVTSNGHEALLAIRMAGDLVGELAAMDGRPRSATVLSAADTRTRLLTSEEFTGFLRQDPDASMAVHRSVAGKLRVSTEYRVNFGGVTVLGRLARAILQLSERYGRPTADGVLVDAPLSQPELAALVGSTEPSVHRALRTLRERRLLTTGYRRLVVTDRAGLETLAVKEAAL